MTDSVRSHTAFQCSSRRSNKSAAGKSRVNEKEVGAVLNREVARTKPDEIPEDNATGILHDTGCGPSGPRGSRVPFGSLGSSLPDACGGFWAG